MKQHVPRHNNDANTEQIAAAFVKNPYEEHKKASESNNMVSASDIYLETSHDHEIKNPYNFPISDL